MTTEVFFCSSNRNKFVEFTAILNSQFPDLAKRLQVSMANVDLPELQGEPEDICSEKCRLAFQQVKRRVIVEDTSLGFHAFKGLPGPYMFVSYTPRRD